MIGWSALRFPNLGKSDISIGTAIWLRAAGSTTAGDDR
jgi:hypothetical protein